MNLYEIGMEFEIECLRDFGASYLAVDIIASKEKSAINKAKKIVPKKMLERLKNIKILNK